MQSVVISYNKKNITPSIYVQSTDYSSTSSGVLYERFAYTAPSSDNSTTSNQKIMQFRLSPSSSYNYFSLNAIACYMKIQHKTITSNGTYYPTDNMTVLKKIIVNVPGATINNYNYGTITRNGSYTIPSGYTGLGSFNVNTNVPVVLMRAYYSNGSYDDATRLNFQDLTNGTYSIVYYSVFVSIRIVENKTIINIVCNNRSTDYNNYGVSGLVSGDIAKYCYILFNANNIPNKICFYGYNEQYITGTVLSDVKLNLLYDYNILLDYDIWSNY